MSPLKFYVLSALTIAAIAASTVRAKGEPNSPSDCNYAYANPGCAAPCSTGACEPNCGCVDSCGGCADSCCSKPCHNANCGKGRGPDKVCCATVEEVTEERSCWKIECDEICVPRVVCPWGDGGSGLTLFNCLKKRCGNNAGCGDCCESCGDVCGGASGCCGGGNGCCLKPRCGDVRCVRDLASEDYEVTKCKCNWEIKDDNCGSGCGGCRCECGDVCGPACASNHNQVPSTPQVAPQPRVNLAKAFAIQTVSNNEPAEAATATPAEPNREPEAAKPSTLLKLFGGKK